MEENARARIGDFELIEKIGEGSLGTVFKAICRVDSSPSLRKGQVVALKKLQPAADLTREIEALRALSHPHIVRFHACFTARQGEWDEAACLVTEFLDGEDLARRLSRAPAGLPWDEARRILLDTLDALAFAESRGVVHRDLKPSNLFLCRDGTVKVIDFGLARRTGGAASLPGGARSVGGLTGTLDFMAPEFARMDGFRGDARSDLFSFGCLAWQAVAGGLPFPELGEHPEIAFIRRWTAAQPPKAALPRPIAYGWEALPGFFARCLNADREARFVSFQEAREALAAVRPRVLAGGEETYTLKAFIASGGFCDVFRARGDRSRREVAVKRLHAGRHEWRFRREAGLMDKLKNLAHPALLKIHEQVEEAGPDGRPCLVMEYLPDEDLRRRLRGARETGRGLPWEEAARLFSRVLEGLEALHRHGVVHRDIKPANLYAPAGRPEDARLLDLGIACEKDGTVSMQGLPPGTLDYMAPELASGSGSRGSPQSDIFALGCSLAEALTGRLPLRPLPREDAPAIRALCARSESESAFLAAFEPLDCPVFQERPELAEICVRALRYDPADRFGGREETDSAWTGAGAREMRLALRALLEASPVEQGVPRTNDTLPGAAPPTSEATVTLAASPRPGGGKPKGAIAVLVLLAVLSVVVARFNFHGRPAPEAGASEVAPAVHEPAPAPPVPEPVIPAPVVVPESPVATPAPVIEPEPAPPPAPAKKPPRTVIRPAPATKPDPPPPPVSLPAEVPTPPATEPKAPAWEGARLATIVARKESAIAEYRAWLYQIADPLRSVTLKRFDAERAKPAWGETLPYLLAAERDALGPDVRRRYERARLWEQAGLAWDGPDVPAKVADGLSRLMAESGVADPGFSTQCAWESGLAAWDGSTVPNSGTTPPVAEARLWRAHALAAGGDDQDAREVLTELAGAAATRGSVIQVEDALLALRAADRCWSRLVRDIRERTPSEVVAPGTGRAVRNPLAAYTQAVERVRDLAAEDGARLLAVARATGAETARALARRIREGAAGATVGDYAFAWPELARSPWREAQTAWTGRQGLTAEERTVLAQIWGQAPLPKSAAEIPVARLRDSR